MQDVYKIVILKYQAESLHEHFLCSGDTQNELEHHDLQKYTILHQ